jgi:Flp pilus assembly protein TadD
MGEFLRRRLPRAVAGTMLAGLALTMAGCKVGEGPGQTSQSAAESQAPFPSPHCSKLKVSPGENARTFDFSVVAEDENVRGISSLEYVDYNFGDSTEAHGTESTSHSYSHKGTYLVDATLVVDMASPADGFRGQPARPNCEAVVQVP